MAQQTVRPITINVSSLAYQNILGRAQAKGMTVTGYATLLFEAAYSARVGREKELPVTDAELDEQVRAIFCLAGEFDATAISRATGFSIGVVERVLAGFGTVAGEKRSKRPAGDMRQGWPPEIYNKVAELWAQGLPGSAIAKAVGKTEGALSVWATKNRDLCPKRGPRGPNNPTIRAARATTVASP